MTTTAETEEAAPKKRSVLNYLSLLCLAIGSAFLTAAVVLIYQYKLGIPFSLLISLLIAAAAALCLPMLVTLVVRQFSIQLSYPGHIAFLLTNLCISVALGSLIF